MPPSRNSAPPLRRNPDPTNAACARAALSLNLDVAIDGGDAAITNFLDNLAQPVATGRSLDRKFRVKAATRYLRECACLQSKIHNGGWPQLPCLFQIERSLQRYRIRKVSAEYSRVPHVRPAQRANVGFLTLETGDRRDVFRSSNPPNPNLHLFPFTADGSIDASRRPQQSHTHFPKAAAQKLF
jgi:hypothetical protein